MLQALLIPLRALGLINGRRPDNGAGGVVVLTREQIHAEAEQLSQEWLHCSAEEAYRRLDAGELEEWAIASELRGYRFLAGESERHSSV
jgi:hypothetical protein